MRLFKFYKIIIIYRIDFLNSEDFNKLASFVNNYVSEST